MFTRRWVVELILDLAGYRAERDLCSLVAVEPACGTGAFLVPMVERLIDSARRHGRDLSDSGGAIIATDLLSANVQIARSIATKQLASVVGSVAARGLATQWIAQADYLAETSDRQADFVLGNPPYVRQENVAAEKLEQYRALYPTMVGRADIYVAFFEKALESLVAGGVLGFISADRWMRNQYGRKLRALIGDGYSMDVNLEMHNVDAFEEQVSAYPAVTVISRRPQGSAVFANAGSGFGKPDAAELSDWVARGPDGTLVKHNVKAGVLPHWFVGEPSWPTGSIERLRMIEDLNDRFDLLENGETGTRVGIGVATGADAVFITANPPQVEPDRLLPISMTRDIVSGRVEWSGHYLINPWAPDGRLVDLTDYPRMADYLETNGPALLKRHVALKRPSAWYRTIDKVDHELIQRPKLLFPDMKLTAHPVLDETGLYPHHNLYYVVSRDWDLRVLGGLLLSKVAELFVDAYSVRMRGGTLRFQAQYLRKIRVPGPASLSKMQADGLAAAFERRDVAAATAIACAIYGIAAVPD